MDLVKNVLLDVASSIADDSTKDCIEGCGAVRSPVLRIGLSILALLDAFPDAFASRSAKRSELTLLLFEVSESSLLLAFPEALRSPVRMLFARRDMNEERSEEGDNSFHGDKVPPAVDGKDGSSMIESLLSE